MECLYFLLSLSPLCQSFHLSFHHFVTLSHSILSLTTLSLCQSFHLFFDHFVTLSVFPSFFSQFYHFFHFFHPSFYHFFTLSVFPSLLLLLCHFVRLSILPFTTLSLCQSFHPSLHLFVTFRAAPVEKTPGSQGWIFLSHRYSDDTIIAIKKLELKPRNTEAPT